MAELVVGGAFLSAALSVLFDKLASRQVFDFFLREKLDEGLLKKFKMVLLAANVLLDDAEMKEFANPKVKEWLDELKDAIYDAEDLLDEICTAATKPKMKSGFPKSIFKARTSQFDARTVEEIIEKIYCIVSEKDLLGLSEGVQASSIRRDPTASLADDSFILSFVGRDKEKKEILKSLLLDSESGDKMQVIAIVGMGGIGKTTLAKILYNDDEVGKHFHQRAWVCVPKEVDVFRLTKMILESVTSSKTDITSLDLLQQKLKKILSGQKLFLVLDDVWNGDYAHWHIICAPFTELSGSKIIVTTRNNDCVASMVSSNHSHSLELLSDDSSWKLFVNHAFGGTKNNDAYPHLEVIGKQIVKKCKGLPLAIKTLGGALRFKDDVKEWEKIMNSEIWDLPVAKSSILPALKLSYHDLPTHLKRCFAYCSIFPQDYEFVKSKLVLLWMAEGLLVDKDENMEELGEDYFDELLSRCFFQKSSGNEACFVMHGLMNDLARYVFGKFCLTFEESKSCQVTDKLPYDDVFRVHHLTTTGICDFLSKLRRTRVLSYSHIENVSELPDSICNLIHLRYLDLSRTSIKTLPDTIWQLYNLQTLLLCKCRDLIKLPENLGELINLRHLDISETALNMMPLQIRRMKSLQTLSTFFLGECNCSGLEELKEFRHLQGSLSIMGLHNVKNVEDVIEANLKEKKGIERLSYSWGPSTVVSPIENDILDRLEPCVNLNHLTLINFGGTRFSKWLGHGSFSKLMYLKISNCVHCLSLPPLGQLPSLTELYIHEMTSVRRVDSEFYGNKLSSMQPFQKLVILKIESMLEWEVWSTPRGDDNDLHFPKLETLWIENCPKLRGNIPKLPPSLTDLQILGCSRLTTTIPEETSLLSLRLRQGCKNVVFENMTTIKSLRSLDIDLQSDSPTFVPNGMIEKCTELEVLNIVEWSSLTHFPEDGLPTMLRELTISFCNNLEFLLIETFHNYKCLLKLDLYDSCDSMTSFPLGLLPNLQVLHISKCKNLESFSIADDHREHLKSLQWFEINDCDQLVNFPSGGLPAPSLNYLQVSSCKNIKMLPERMHAQLTSLEALRLFDCEEVESFPAGGLPSNLDNLLIRNCKKLTAKRKEWDLQTASSLHCLEIEQCEDVESFPEEGCRLPTSINWLKLSDLPNLKTIDGSRLISHLPSLCSLMIQNCPKVTFKPNIINTAQEHLPISFRLAMKNCPTMKKQMGKVKKGLSLSIEIDGEVFN